MGEEARLPPWMSDGASAGGFCPSRCIDGEQLLNEVRPVPLQPGGTAQLTGSELGSPSCDSRQRRGVS